MSDEIRHAFAHPAERAEASAGAAPLDRISLRDHVIEAEIGAFQLERGVRQRLRFSVVVEVGRGEPALDDVDRILSYDKVTEAIAAELAAERLNLLETLADRIAARILAEPMARRVFLRIEKLDRGPGALGVEIVRSSAGGAANVLTEAPHPRVAWLTDEALTSPRLAELIDTLADVPLILTLGPAMGPHPRASSPLVQRRIDLLAIEQNAWLLAARDRRCIVTGTRTELDWAARQGQISVWAPSKIVLDALDAPMGTDPLALAAWFAGQMQAVELVTVGAPPPPASVPTRQAPLP